MIVNNASTDDTAKIAKSFRNAIRSEVLDVIILEEARPGLNHARETGISGSSGEYVVLCDDDNWLDHHYITHVVEFFGRHEQAGIVGGKNHAEFESEPPKCFNEVRNNFAVGEFGEAILDMTDLRGFVWGAGMAFRRTVFEDLKKMRHQMLTSDRSGKSLSSGGDSEFCFAARLLGYRIYYHPDLQLKHYISKERLAFSYIQKLNFSFGRATPMLDCYKKKYHEQPEAIRPSLWISEAIRQVQILARKKKGLLIYLFTKREDMRTISLGKHLGRLTQLLSLRRSYASKIKASIQLFSKPLSLEGSSSKYSDA